MVIIPTTYMAAALIISLYSEGAFVQPNVPGLFFYGFEFELPYPEVLPEEWDWQPTTMQGLYVLTGP